MKTGGIFVVMGPSGVGKTTLVDAVLADQKPEMRLTMVTPYTTRAPRSGETSGAHFHFISTQAFEQKRDEGFFLEWSCAYQACYGTSKAEVEERRIKGYNVILVIDRVGAKQVRALLPETVIIRIAPPSESELERRLRSRKTQNEETIRFRLEQARREAEEERENPLSDNVIVNDDLVKATAELQSFLAKFAA